MRDKQDQNLDLCQRTLTPRNDSVNSKIDDKDELLSFIMQACTSDQRPSTSARRTIQTPICRVQNQTDVNIEENDKQHNGITLNKPQSNKILDRIKNKCGLQQIVNRCRTMKIVPGSHSLIAIETAGFDYIPSRNVISCKKCHLEITDWEPFKNLFSVHAGRSPNCDIVQAIKLSSEHSLLSSCRNATTLATSSSTDYIESEKPSKRQKLDMPNKVIPTPLLFEVDIMKQIRRHTFSHWSTRNSISKSELIEAGFFSCSIGDRVICIYCGLICQQWTQQTDDPCEVHKTLSPKCPYVINMLASRAAVSLTIINQNSESEGVRGPAVSDGYHSQEIVRAAPCNPNYGEIPKRYQSFSTWSVEASPSVDDLVRAGFYYTGTATVVTCFFCNGSLQNWGAKDNPIIEHVRWFPSCGYAKQLCGDNLYRKIQESKRIAQERARSTQIPNNLAESGQRLLIPDESTLSRFVASRIDLPVSQNLLKQNYKATVVKRCWEDQLRFKLDDFPSDCDVLMACYILQKQINGIMGKKENIIVPSVKMRELRDALQSELVAAQSSLSTTITSTSTTSSNNSDVEMTTESKSSTNESNVGLSINKATMEIKQSPKDSTANHARLIENTDTGSKNICALCMEEEKCLACIPCGHLSTCVACGYSIQTCPICRQKIEAYIRVYI